jgi:hypothetical protein
LDPPGGVGEAVERRAAEQRRHHRGRPWGRLPGVQARQWVDQSHLITDAAEDRHLGEGAGIDLERIRCADPTLAEHDRTHYQDH